jgi:hypothetical protein
VIISCSLKYDSPNLEVQVLIFISPSHLSQTQSEFKLCYDRLLVRHPSRTHDQIFNTVRHLLICWCEVPSLTRGLVCSLQLLMDLTTEVILRSESCWCHDHFWLFQIRDSPPPIWRLRLLHLYPPGTGWPSYAPKHCVSFLSPLTTLRPTVEAFDMPPLLLNCWFSFYSPCTDYTENISIIALL